MKLNSTRVRAPLGACGASAPVSHCMLGNMGRRGDMCTHGCVSKGACLHGPAHALPSQGHLGASAARRTRRDQKKCYCLHARARLTRTRARAPPAQCCSNRPEEGDVCWICLDGTEQPGNPLCRPCSCPRYSHKPCLARWQLQSAGSRCARVRACASLPHSQRLRRGDQGGAETKVVIPPEAVRLGRWWAPKAVGRRWRLRWPEAVGGAPQAPPQTRRSRRHLRWRLRRASMW
jgi:hypothetical protein